MTSDMDDFSSEEIKPCWKKPRSTTLPASLFEQSPARILLKPRVDVCGRGGIICRKMLCKHVNYTWCSINFSPLRQECNIILVNIAST
jgi:hypothetical protein